jgi:ribosomal protein L11 methyltransferase
MNPSAVNPETPPGFAAGGKTWPHRMEDRQIPLPRSADDSPGWIEITVCIHPAAHDALAAFFFDHGFNGVLTEETPPCIKAYLPVTADADRVIGQIRGFLKTLTDLFPEAQSATFDTKRIEHEDWGLTWRRFFTAERVTPHLLVQPPWEPSPPPVADHVLLMDPGPAFGTGKHATTRMCLEAMEQVVFPAAWTMIDVGTGSGILALYGALLGAAKILALDTDPEALSWAKRNMALNGCPKAIELSSRPLEAVTERFHLVVANLNLATILELLPHLIRVLREGGTLILSGLLREQCESVIEALSRYETAEPRLLTREEWAALVIRRAV